MWWQWLSRMYRRRGKLVRWKDFEKELMVHFGPLEYTDYDEALSHIRQMGTLREYQKEFERLANRVRDWPEKALVGAFIGGLKPELAAEVRVYRPHTYADAMEMARLRDDHLQATRKGNQFGSKRLGVFHSESKTIENNGSTPNKAIPQGVKRLPWEELQKRREKGLFFNCDEKFVPGHRCKIKQHS